MLRSWSLAVSMLALAESRVLARDVIDPQLLAAVNEIAAIDNHSHIEPVEAARPDRWHRENPLGVSGYPDVVPLSRDHADWHLAWRALYAYTADDATLPHLQALLE